jgi:hypothetical protein
MATYFNDLVEKTAGGEKSAVRALQAWQYLIGKAKNRQIVRYDELRVLMDYSDNRPLGVILGCIMFYCQQNGLPPLTIIVVNQHGVPGDGFSVEDFESYHQCREDVFEFPWFKLVPPSIEEFYQARKMLRANAQSLGAIGDSLVLD